MKTSVDKKYKLVEIFKSIQGEGYNFGKEVVFIRFCGCNLNCPWCDTNVNKCNLKLTAKEIKKEVEKFNCKNIIFTGGEPTMQDLESIYKVLGDKYWYGIETNGLNKVPRFIHWISCSPKFKFREIPLNIKFHLVEINNHFCARGEMRLVVDDDSVDFINWATILSLKYPNIKFYLSPCEVGNWKMGETPEFDWDKLAKVYNVLKNQGFGISVQIHKLWNKR